MVKKVVCLIGLLGMLLSSARGGDVFTASEVVNGAMWQKSPEMVKRALGGVKPEPEGGFRIFCKEMTLAGIRLYNVTWEWEAVDSPAWYKELYAWKRFWAPPPGITKEQVAEWGKKWQELRLRKVSAKLFSTYGLSHEEMNKRFRESQKAWGKVMGSNGSRKMQKKGKKSAFSSFSWEFRGEDSSVSLGVNTDDERANDSGGDVCVEIYPTKRNAETAGKVKKLTFTSMVEDGTLWELSPQEFKDALLKPSQRMSPADVKQWKNQVVMSNFDTSVTSWNQGQGRKIVQTTSTDYDVPQFSLWGVSLNKAVYFWNNGTKNSVWGAEDAHADSNSMRLQRISCEPIVPRVNSDKKWQKELISGFIKKVKKQIGNPVGDVVTKKDDKKSIHSYMWRASHYALRIEMLYDKDGVCTDVLMTVAPNQSFMDYASMGIIQDLKIREEIETSVMGETQARGR